MKLTVPIRSTGKAVLAVPVAAVSVAADGSSRVEVEDGAAGPTRFVRVRTGLAAEGYVEVVPTDGKLAAGAQVVVGNQTGTLLEGTVEENDRSSDTAAPESSVASETDTGRASETSDAQTPDTTGAP